MHSAQRYQFAPITLRPATDGKWWALNKREHGFASYGFPFVYLGDALDRFDARIIAWGRDRHGLYLMAQRCEGAEVS